jgi:hypothetical protein
MEGTFYRSRFRRRIRKCGCLQKFRLWKSISNTSDDAREIRRMKGTIQHAERETRGVEILVYQ